MSVLAPAASGLRLDRRIARLIDGPRTGSEALPYSTDEHAADGLMSRLEQVGLTAELEQEKDRWYCVFWAPRIGDGQKERIASGSAVERPLAICRAVLNLPLSGSGSRLHLRSASRGWIGQEAGRVRKAPDGDSRAETDRSRRARPR